MRDSRKFWEREGRLYWRKGRGGRRERLLKVRRRRCIESGDYEAFREEMYKDAARE